jgi:hypothetical protein
MIRCALAILMALTLAAPASAQSGAPIKIGYSMSLTGGLAANGRSALLAQHLWEDDTNSKGGMLGRPVKLVYYDDKSSPRESPTIYTKLLDIDKVDLIIGGYGTALTAPAMPIVIQSKKRNGRFCSDRARDRGCQSRPRGHLLIPARLGRHGARDERARVQTESDRRRDGWIAVNGDQGAAALLMWINAYKA